MPSEFPSLRVRSVNDGPICATGDYVVYWMTAFRRTRHNWALERAVEWARRLDRPLIVFEPLRCDYRWASDRLHRFVIEGMADNGDDLAKRPASYYPYIEPERGAGRGLLAALAARACLVVTDDYPAFFLPRMLRAAAAQLPVQLEAVDSNGILPLRAADRVFARAFDFRRFLQRELRPYLAEAPRPSPLARAPLPRLKRLPTEITGRWPAADPRQWLDEPKHLAALPIDHCVRPVEQPGGRAAAAKCLKRFLTRGLDRYGLDRNHPDEEATSGLSPYLHFGHVSAHEIFDRVTRTEEWSPADLAEKATGSSQGWWGASEAAEGFLDQLITWRELGFNMSWQRDDADRYDSLPGWAQKTLAEHADDPRDALYDLARFEAADTHDPLWNAAQRQLVREGRLHNYLRMLWGKQILAWSASPREALATMIELNNKWALDGRDPNSYSGIFWVLGRYDRAWGPERPVFGKIRYMTSGSAARKLRLKKYLQRYGPSGEEPVRQPVRG